MPDDKREPWEKRPGETQRAYEAFCIYMGMGPLERSLRAVHDELYGEDAANIRHVERWSRDHDWVDRAEAHDQHVNDQILKELESERVRSRLKRIRAGDELLERGLELLDSLNLQDGEWQDAIRALKEADRILRAGHDDEPTQNIEADGVELTWPEDEE